MKQKLKENVTIFGAEKVRIMRIKNVMINKKLTELVETITEFQKKRIFGSHESNAGDIGLETVEEIDKDALNEDNYEAEIAAL